MHINKVNILIKYNLFVSKRIKMFVIVELYIKKNHSYFQSATGTCGCQDLALMSCGLTNEHPPQKLTSNGWHSSERP